MEKRLLDIAKNNNKFINDIPNSAVDNNNDNSFDANFDNEEDEFSDGSYSESEVDEDGTLTGGAMRRRRRRVVRRRRSGGKLKQRGWKDLLSTAITGSYDTRTGRQKGRGISGGRARRPKKMSSYNMFVKKHMPAALRKTGHDPQRAMSVIASSWRGRGRGYAY